MSASSSRFAFGDNYYYASAPTVLHMGRSVPHNRHKQNIPLDTITHVVRLLSLTVTFCQLPELLGGEDAGGRDRVVAHHAVVRVVRVA